MRNTDDGEGGAAVGASRLQCENFLAATVPIAGTAGEMYLRSRGLERRHTPTALASLCRMPASVKAALVATLQAPHGRLVVGVQLTYLDPAGRKSTVEPPRRRFNLEKSPGAGFLLRSSAGGTLLIGEGLEDGLSLTLLGTGPGPRLARYWRLETSLELPKDRAVVVFRDGDAPGKPADRGLVAGVDHLLLEGAAVKVTNTPDGQDANSILQAAGPDALRALIDDAAEAELSLDGDIQRIARLDGGDYERERHLVAQRHKPVRLTSIDSEVQRLRPKPEDPVDPTTLLIEEDEPWLGPVDLATTLDGILVEFKRYIVASETQLVAVVAWCAFTHLVHHPIIRLAIAPQLAVQAPTPDSEVRRRRLKSQRWLRRAA